VPGSLAGKVNLTKRDLKEPTVGGLSVVDGQRSSERSACTTQELPTGVGWFCRGPVMDDMDLNIRMDG
jgi:hypothetical protein